MSGCLVLCWWILQASGKAKQKLAAVVDADSEAEPAASDSDFEPDKEAEAESEVGFLPTSNAGHPSMTVAR